MKAINRQRQAIRDYSRTKEVYTQYRESGWSVKFYQEHRQEIEDHKNAQEVYSSLDGKMPTLKELMAEYDELKERKDDDQAALDELKPKLTDLKHMEKEKDATQTATQEVADLLSWADTFDEANAETKHMIIARLVERIEINHDYEVQIKFRISVEQYMRIAA